MDRRMFLAMNGSILVAGLAGCASLIADSETETPDRPWDQSDPITDPDGTHHLFVENHTEMTETAWLRVVREDGTSLVDGRYELPDGRGLKFEAIAAWERTYRIDVAIDGEDVATVEWETPECGPDSEAPGDVGSRNAAVQVVAAEADENRVSLTVDQCDAVVSPSVPTGPAETFRIDA